jgi:hypothetical protein
VSRAAAPKEAPKGSGPPASSPRPVSWVITAIVVGWLIVYNGLRIAGDSPHRAAVVAIAPGVALGLALFGLAVLVRRAMLRSGRLPARGNAALNRTMGFFFFGIGYFVWRAFRRGGEPPGRTTDPIGPQELAARKAALRVAAAFLALAAAVAIVVGIVLGVDWFRLPGSERSTTKVALAIWDIVAGVWFAAEVGQLLNGHEDGLDSVALGAVLTAVLGGVALSRSMFPPVQVVLIVVLGTAAVVSASTLWRIKQSGGTAAAAVAAAAVSALALIIPLVSG